MTVDYRRISELFPELPGQLPDVEGVFMRTKNAASRWLATIDLSDVCFGIPLRPQSRDQHHIHLVGKTVPISKTTTGHINSPVIAQNVLRWSLDEVMPAPNCRICSYVDDLLIRGQDMSI